MKKKLILFTLIISFGQITFSQVSQLEDDSRFQEGLFEEYLSEYAEIINHEQFLEDSSYQISKLIVSDSCKVFMDKDELLGSVGKSIFKSISTNSKNYPQLLSNGTLGKFCRKYPNMTTQRKALVWVMLMTAVAHFESSCSDSASAKGPNGTAYGLYQLHKGKEENYDGATKACIKNASLDPKLSSTCALMMIENQLTKSGGVLFYKDSYWDVLRPNGRSGKAKFIAETLVKSSLCNPLTI
ncbi:MAG: hypothetical protein WA160_14605 [Pseudobdellovibrio sp.]